VVPEVAEMTRKIVLRQVVDAAVSMPQGRRESMLRGAQHPISPSREGQSESETEGRRVEKSMLRAAQHQKCWNSSLLRIGYGAASTTTMLEP
jgi:hypothetical protein